MYQSAWLCLLLVTVLAVVPEEHQYCAIRYRRLCQGKGRHVACQFPDSGPGSSCERYTPIKFTNDLKHFITHYLNRRRQRIASGNERVRGGVHLPKPQIMMLVEWDRELSQLAQRLADQCHFVHDDCRATVKYPYAGQTVGEVRWRRSSDSDELSAQRAIRRVLDAWWGERRRAQPKQLTAPFRLTAKGTVWGHFSQLAVWNLQAVGCGAVRHGAHHPRLLLVCDFSHTNMLGQRTLVPGPMAPCPIHTARRPRSAYPALCGPVRHPAPQERDDLEMEEYDDEDDDSEEAETVEVGDVPTPSIWHKRTETYRTSTRSITRATVPFSTLREFPGAVSRQQDLLGIYRGEIDRFTESATTLISIQEPIREKAIRDREKNMHQDIDRDREPPRDRPEIRHRDDQRDQVRSRDRGLIRSQVRHRAMERDREIDTDRHKDLVMDEQSRRKAIFKHEKEFFPMESTDWPTKKPLLERPYGQRQGNESPSAENERDRDLEQVIPLTGPRRQSTQPQEPRMVEVYRPTIGEDNSDPQELESESEPGFRSRFQQTRSRPKRPGANALLHTSTIKVTKKPAMSVLKLDKEDIDQLFRDTGFNMDWRKQTT
ncbi:unnamed protein product [Arctia plantaginis]|uniref:SCP domain-containing protein n=1 Tax=Arctia plantaginis TaxID=874455 RepID=A0A8S1BFS2_ARCPL|nr:unnamed protein product [Arctia plantaginis]